MLCVYTYTCVASEVRAFCCSKFCIRKVFALQMLDFEYLPRFLRMRNVCDLVMYPT